MAKAALGERGAVLPALQRLHVVGRGGGVRGGAVTESAAGYRETIHPAIRATTSRSIPL